MNNSTFKNNFRNPKVCNLQSLRYKQRHNCKVKRAIYNKHTEALKSIINVKTNDFIVSEKQRSKE